MNLTTLLLQSENPLKKVFFLGTGTASINLPIKTLQEFTFSELDLPGIEIPGHKGKVELATCKDFSILLFRGRWHFYEGHREAPYCLILEALKKLPNYSSLEIYFFFAAGALGTAVKTHEIAYVTKVLSTYQFGSSVTIDYTLDNLKLFNKLGLSEAKYFTGMVGPTYGTPQESNLMRMFGYTHVGMSFTIESIAFKNFPGSLFLFVVTTDIASGLLNDFGEYTTHHSHELVLNNFRKNEKNIVNLILNLLI